MEEKRSSLYKRNDSGVDLESTMSLSSMTSQVTVEHGTGCVGKLKKCLEPLKFLNEPPLANWISWTFVVALVYGALWAYYPEEMTPNESGFSLVLTLLLCFVGEVLVGKIPTPEGFPGVPPLLASLGIGLLLRNVPAPVNIATHIDDESSKKLRELSLTVVLTAAGLEIDPEAMRKVKYAVLRLAFTPCLFETTVYGILAHFLLGFPYTWSFMMGFMIAAVSPAVVIPSLIQVQEKKYGVKKGVPSLVMAASGIDDVLAIAGFTILLGLNIPTGIEKDVIEEFSAPVVKFVENTTEIMPGSNETTSDFNVGVEVAFALLEVVIGALAGIVCGVILGYFPTRNMKYKTFVRGAILLMNGIVWVFGTEHWGIEGAGAICALVMSFVAALIWGDEREPLAHGWEQMWRVFQPILFGLTGAMVDVNTFDGETVGYGFICIITALIVRMIVAALVSFGVGLNKTEKAYVSICWVPKGTVQAALGSAALDLALQENSYAPDHENHIKWGQQILVLAVLATIFTAPIGAVAISYFGPKMLQYDGDDLQEEEDVEAGKDNKCFALSEGDSAISSNSEHSECKNSPKMEQISERIGEVNEKEAFYENQTSF